MWIVRPSLLQGVQRRPGALGWPGQKRSSPEERALARPGRAPEGQGSLFWAEEMVHGQAPRDGSVRLCFLLCHRTVTNLVWLAGSCEGMWESRCEEYLGPAVTSCIPVCLL